MKIEIILLLFLGIFLVVTYLVQVSKPPNKVEFKYIPRTLEQSFNDPISANLQYGTLFQFAGPYPPQPKLT